MYAYIVRRLLIAVVLVVGVATMVFSLLHIMPGDPVLLILGSNPSAEAIEAFRSALGLDKPLHIQYYEQMKGLFKLNLGRSLRNNYPVNSYIVEGLPRTIELIVFALILALIIGIPFGVFSAVKRGSILDSMTTTATVIGLSSPNFVLGTVMVIIFALKLKVLPSGGYTLFSVNPIDHLRRLIMPGITLAIPLIAITTRMTRSSLLEVLNKDYICTARSKGLKERNILFKHALRNSMIPIVTMLGARTGSLLGGTVIVEFIFYWPGLSTLLIHACYQRDYPVIQGIIVTVAGIVILLNLAVDLLLAALDPRIRLD